MKIVSWNTNGLRAAMSKGFGDYIVKTKSDIVMLQEAKVGDLPNEFIDLCDSTGFKISHNPTNRRGYSGTICLYRKKPNRVFFDLGVRELDHERRLITLDYTDYYVINVYTPNSKGSLERNYFRTKWDEAFQEYIEALQEKNGGNRRRF